jgi:DivIVA domain-containing protein
VKRLRLQKVRLTKGGCLPLTPEAIRQRRFRVDHRGYERSDVDSFVSQIAADYELAISALGAALNHGAERSKLDTFLRNSSAIAEEASSEVVDAEAKADEILQEARKEASTILTNAAHRALDLVREAESFLDRTRSQRTPPPRGDKDQEPSDRALVKTLQGPLAERFAEVQSALEDLRSKLAAHNKTEVSETAASRSPDVSQAPRRTGLVPLDSLLSELPGSDSAGARSAGKARERSARRSKKKR